MLTKFLNGYYWHSIQDFLVSLAPSTRYHISLEVVLMSGFGAMVQLLFGFKELTLIAFTLAAIVELSSGVYASVFVKKEVLQSGKMGRFVIKLAIWLAVFFILNQFVAEYKDRSDMVAGTFNWLYNTLIVWCAGEYVVSILENASTIAGKEKSALIEAIKTKLQKLLDL